MKCLILGDIHCREYYKDIIDKEFNNVDKIIFLGDYLTPREYKLEDPTDVSAIMYEILDLKDKHPDKIVLLRGNHDSDNLGYPWGHCQPHDDYSAEYMSRKDVKEWFLKNTQWVYLIPNTNYLCSHAGVSSYFMKSMIENMKLSEVEDINTLTPSFIFAFTPDNPWDLTGDSVTQPCTWIRPNTLIMDKLKGFKQIVGHTQVEKPYCLDNYVYLFDALANGWYGILDNEENRIYICNIKTNEEESI